LRACGPLRRGLRRPAYSHHWSRFVEN
jgi:hypothetical protein